MTVGKYDVVVEVGSSYATQRLETVKYMTELFKTMPQLAPQFLDILMKYMDFPGADEIYARLQQMQNQPPKEDPMDEFIKQQAMIDLEKAKLDVPKKQIENQLAMKELENSLFERIQEMQKVEANKLKHIQGMQDIALKADKLNMDNEAHILDITERMTDKTLKEKE